MTIKEKMHGNVAVLTFKGNLMGEPDTTEVREKIYNLLQEGFGKIVLDMGQVKWVNSSGLGTLIAAMTSVKNKGERCGLLVLLTRWKASSPSPSSSKFSRPTRRLTAWSPASSSSWHRLPSSPSAQSSGLGHSGICDTVAGIPSDGIGIIKHSIRSTTTLRRTIKNLLCSRQIAWNTHCRVLRVQGSASRT